MKFGQLVKSTDKALQHGVFEKKVLGIVIHEDGEFVWVAREGRRNSSRYSKEFWEKRGKL